MMESAAAAGEERLVGAIDRLRPSSIKRGLVWLVLSGTAAASETLSVARHVNAVCSQQSSSINAAQYADNGPEFARVYCEAEDLSRW